MVETNSQARMVKEIAAKMKIKIPEPMSVKTFFDTSQEGCYKKNLIDESPRFIEEALKRYFEGVEIDAVTMSLDDI